jgi:hypothetical protein
MTSGYLTSMQRAAPPIDRWSARRLESAGGYEVADPRTLAVGLEDEKARYPGDEFDSEIVRDRHSYYQQPRMPRVGDGWVNWTAAGPLRPELHQRSVSWRNMVGNSASRFPVVATPTTGMHTMGPSGVARTVPRFVTTPQMTAARPFRLSPGQYSGQTYSQTTKIQGRGRR